MFTFKAGTFSRDDLIARFKEFVAAAELSKSTNQQWRANVQAERELELQVRPLRQGVRGIAQARFGRDGAQLLQLGFAPAKPIQKSVKVKALAVARSQATRTARSTRGKQQKKSIHGTVTTTGTTPATATAPQPAPTAAPAAAPVTTSATTAATPAPAPVAHPAGNTQS
jgi:hypothetical protein